MDSAPTRYNRANVVRALTRVRGELDSMAGKAETAGDGETRRRLSRIVGAIESLAANLTHRINLDIRRDAERKLKATHDAK